MSVPDKKIVLAEGEKFLKEYAFPFSARMATAITFTNMRLVMRSDRPKSFYRKEINMTDVAGIAAGYGVERFWRFSKGARFWGWALFVIGLLAAMAGAVLTIIGIRLEELLNIYPWDVVIIVGGALLAGLGSAFIIKPKKKFASLTILLRTPLSPALSVGVIGEEKAFLQSYEDRILLPHNEATLAALNEIGALLLNIRANKPIDKIFE